MATVFEMFQNAIASARDTAVDFKVALDQQLEANPRRTMTAIAGITTVELFNFFSALSSALHCHHQGMQADVLGNTLEGTMVIGTGNPINGTMLSHDAHDIHHQLDHMSDLQTGVAVVNGALLLLVAGVLTYSARQLMAPPKQQYQPLPS